MTTPTAPATPVFDALLARRSAKAADMTGGPTQDQLERILFAGTRAPDHGRLAPYRFIVIADSARQKFADVLAAAARQSEPKISDAEVERAAAKAFEGPCVVALIGRIDPAHPKIPASDQWLAVGCVLENLLLAAGEMGFAVAVRSGRALETAAVKTAFGLSDIEHLTAFLVIGRAKDFPPERPKPELAKVLSVWGA